MLLFRENTNQQLLLELDFHSQGRQILKLLNRNFVTRSVIVKNVNHKRGIFLLNLTNADQRHMMKICAAF